ncbi:MAG: response regulator [Alphaproteobacteria bacterium]|nr:response regulator [Alphaproteobacteria bacterium]
MPETEIPNRQTVVIVDDRATNLKILERLAQSLDQVDVRLFDHPQRALDDAARSPPDLVLTDFNMPDLDGAAFIHRFRAVAGCADVPVIVVTAYEDRDLRYQALEAGATDFLLSPVDHHEFRVRSRNLLTMRRQQLLLRARASSLEEKIVEDARRHRNALRESHELLLRVIDAVPLAVVATDRDGRYVFVNDWFARSVGKNPAAIIGETPTAVSSDLYARESMERDRRIMGGLEADGSSEHTVTLPEGEQRVVLSSKALLRDAVGRPMLVVTAALDITARKEAELALIAAKEEAELASRSKSEFLANMSHELRTPLNAIIGFSQVMADEVMGPLGSPRYTGYARDICASAQHLLGIISDILDVSKLEAGKIELDEETIELPQIVHDVLQLVAERARAIDISIAADLPPDLPALHADGLKLKQVLLNLVTNAIKFSHAGGRVELTARFGADGFDITVVDHGIGMDAGEIQTAVTRFGQVASTWSRRHAGTGLGLPLAIGLVELHGGRLTIESRKDAGTTVRVHLPVERAVAVSAPVGA